MLLNNKSTITQDSTKTQEENIISTEVFESHIECESSKKNAFKIIFGKGVKLTNSARKALNDTIGCYFDSFYRAYVCPMEKRNTVVDFFNESKIEAKFVDVLDINKGRDRKIIKLENRIEILQKKNHEEDMRLLSEIAQYDSKRSAYDFEETPIFEKLTEHESEDRKKIRFSIELDFHKRYIKNKEDRKEIENLRNSCTLHEKEENADEKLLERLEKNEIGDAELFIDLFKDKYIFDTSEGKFYIWNSKYWELDTYKERYNDFDIIADYYLTASKDDKLEEKTKQALFARSKQLRTNNRRRNVLETITAYTSFRGVWDYVPKLLPCSNGIIDLRTGDFLNSREDQFIRKICPIKYNKSAKCPKFIQFLDDISLGNIEWIKFLQRSIGYALLGVPVEEVLIYWYGEGGRNGKGTLTKILQHVFGPFARTFPAEMLLLQRNLPSSSSPSPELANLEGVRIAIFSEINEGRKIDSAKVKNLSGRDKISCRRLFSNLDLQIEPTHTMFLQTNYKPKAPADDNALWSRNILVSFNASFVREPNKKNERPLKANLKEELLKEDEGILIWVLDGVREYLKIGLQIPDFIKAETESYRKENDGIGRFLDEMCIFDPVFSTQKSRIETAIKEFCFANDCKVPKRNDVSSYLKERFRESRCNRVRVWQGVKIIEENDIAIDFHS